MLQAIFIAAIWAVPVYVLFAVLDSVISRKVRDTIQRICLYFGIVTIILSIARTLIILPAISCPPAVRANTADFSVEPVEVSCNIWSNVLIAFIESLWKSAYVALLVVLFALVGYAISRAVNLRSPHLRGYVAAAFAMFLFVLTLVVFPWICAGWVSSSL